MADYKLFPGDPRGQRCSGCQESLRSTTWSPRPRRTASYRLLEFASSLLPRDEDLILTPPISLSQHPADILRDLEQEAVVLARLHLKIQDQLHRLQLEEMAIRKTA